MIDWTDNIQVHLDNIYNLLKVANNNLISIRRALQPEIQQHAVADESDDDEDADDVADDVADGDDGDDVADDGENSQGWPTGELIAL